MTTATRGVQLNYLQSSDNELYLTEKSIRRERKIKEKSLSWYIIIVLAVGLAMDAMAASIAAGAAGGITPLEGIKMAVSFGLFQFAMPIIGWSLGSTVVHRIEGYDHWIAFFILLAIGGKMILDSFKKQTTDKPVINPSRTLPLLAMSIATSIDALAAGLSLALLDSSIIWLAAGVIGIITAVLSVFGIVAGKHLGQWLGSKAKILGGCILIFIGTKMLLEHTRLGI